VQVIIPEEKTSTFTQKEAERVSAFPYHAEGLVNLKVGAKKFGY
jgi:hypothetical protein